MRQFEPQLLMVLTRARASQAIQAGDYSLAIEKAEEGVEQLRDFFRETGHADALERSAEILSLETWLQELRAERPLTQVEKLELELKQAIQTEDYERAARLRDELKDLKSAE